MSRSRERTLSDEADDEFVDDDLPRNGMKYLRRSGVPRGIGMIFFGMMTMVVTALVLAIVTLPLAWLLGKLTRSLENAWPSIIILGIYFVVFGGGWLVGFILTVVGKIFCLDVPKQLGVQWSVIVSTILGVFGLVIMLLTFVPALNGLYPMTMPLFLVGNVVFAEFLRKIATFAGKTWLRDFAIVIMVAYGLCFFCSVAGATIMFTIFRSAPGMVLFVMSILGMLVSFVLYAVLLSKWKYFLGV